MISENSKEPTQNTVVGEIDYCRQYDTGCVHLSLGEMPSIFRFLIEVSDKACSLLDSAAILLALLDRHGRPACRRNAIPISTRRGMMTHSSSLIERSTKGISSSFSALYSNKSSAVAPVSTGISSFC